MFLIGVAAGVLGGVLVALLVVYSRTSQRAGGNLVGLKSEIRDLERAIASLQQLSAEYFNSIKPTDFDRLRRILLALQQVEELCESLYTNRADREVAETVQYVVKRGGRGVAPASLGERLGDVAADLVDWRSVSQNTIAEIIQRVKETSEAFSQVGRVRASKRSPTSVLLGELKTVIQISEGTRTMRR